MYIVTGLELKSSELLHGVCPKSWIETSRLGVDQPLLNCRAGLRPGSLPLLLFPYRNKSFNPLNIPQYLIKSLLTTQQRPNKSSTLTRPKWLMSISPNIGKVNIIPIMVSTDESVLVFEHVVETSRIDNCLIERNPHRSSSDSWV